MEFPKVIQKWGHALLSMEPARGRLIGSPHMGWWLPNPHAVPTPSQVCPKAQAGMQRWRGKRRFTGPKKERCTDGKERHMVKKKRQEETERYIEQDPENQRLGVRQRRRKRGTEKWGETDVQRVGCQCLLHMEDKEMLKSRWKLREAQS